VHRALVLDPRSDAVTLERVETYRPPDGTDATETLLFKRVATDAAPAPLPTAAPGAPGAKSADLDKDAAAGDPCAGPGRLVKTDLTCADRKRWYAALAWPKDCEEAYDNTAIRGAPAIEFYDVGGGCEVLAVRCTLGAYQGYSHYLRLENTDGGPLKASLLSFRTYDAPREGVLRPTSVTEVWGNAEFDAAKKVLVVHNRYRGPGDCGSLATYAFKDGRPAAVEFRSKNRCDGRGGDPAEWPRIKLP
jgi:hypothetical protein